MPLEDTSKSSSPRLQLPLKLPLRHRATHQSSLCWSPFDDQLTPGLTPPANFSLRPESKPAILKLPQREGQGILSLPHSKKAFRCTLCSPPRPCK